MRWRPPTWAVDAAFVAVAAAELGTVLGRIGPAAVGVYSLAVASLAVRRRWPLAVVLTTLPAAVHGYLWLAPMIALGTAASLLPRRRVVYGCAALMFLAPFVQVEEAEEAGPAREEWAVDEWAEDDFPMDEWADALLGHALFCAGPTALGRLARTRRELATHLAELVASRERERAVAAERAVVAERARLAREIHDVVSHQVSLIAVEAGALQLTAADAEARGSGERIGALSTRTLEELRDMLGALRVPDSRDGPPGLAELPALVADSGIAVLDGEPPEPVGAAAAETGRAAFRIVQESLTNASKHAPGSTVRVSVTAEPAAGVLVVEVVNGPPPARVPAPRTGARPPVSGYGLVGLAERSAVLGGTVLSRPTPDGGFEVRAELPWPGTTHRTPPGPAGSGNPRRPTPR
ncbi:sensor histidine kinase [Streptomyces sp. NPDC059567]|uniref:sensor histidine kinase n=1 Tax=Streptomyces sp. NPDC059567 TaxID=3346867 RepID=UPI00367594E1